ncbi:hypothetical protein [Lacihabitans sp. CCS-44]|uniref:hypothetical protein n=1 Tax=Lacihabitans sp. CCS-44 TaxID=2487331 RepID=UPI0020CE6387|nr:hypothetical protein [Lacihabitans sp. CCS-44]
MRFVLLLLLFSTNLTAQIIQNVELEVVGRPSWQNIITIGKNGLLLFVKTDQAKAKAVMYDGDLQKKWESDIFLDVERAPTAYTFNQEQITFLFRETSGMYYQVLIFDLATGIFKNRGFELRDFFEDQSYVFLKNKVILAGATKESAAFYTYDFETEVGKMTLLNIKGKVVLQEMNYDEKSKKIHSIWSVKEIAYTNAKKKRGEYIKDAFLNVSVFDTAANVLETNKISQKFGNFPMTAKSVLMPDDSRVIVGTYQSKDSQRGVFYLPDYKKNASNIAFKPFSDLLQVQSEIPEVELQKILKEYTFLMHEPIFSNQSLTMGGAFYKPEYKTVSQQVYNPYDNFSSNRNSGFGRSNTRSQTVFSGYNYSIGFIANVQFHDGSVVSNRIDIKQMSPQIRQPLSFNNAGSVAYCVRGNLATKNFNIGTKPILYKLSEEELTASNQSFLPAFQEVKFWHDNYFIANGSKNKLEVLKVAAKAESGGKKRKKNQSATFTQVRKTIYLTKIASGSVNQN